MDPNFNKLCNTHTVILQAKTGQVWSHLDFLVKKYYQMNGLLFFQENVHVQSKMITSNCMQ